MKNYIIDVIADQVDFKKRNVIYPDQANLISVNILLYIKEMYDIGVSDLALMFDVHRQTIYNYFKISTKELPEIIKHQIASVYGTFSFENVLEKELKIVNLDIELSELFRYTGYGSLYENMSKELKEVVEIVSYNYDSEIHGLKEEFDFKKLWQDAAKEKKIIDILEPKHPLFDIIEEAFRKNTLDYNKKLVEKIKQLNPNDFEFLSVIEEYIKYKKDKTEGAKLTRKEDIIKRIDRFINNKGIISLDKEDFGPLDKILEYKVYNEINLDTFNPTTDIKDTTNKTLILGIISDPNISLLIISDILTKIRENIGIENIIYGQATGSKANELKVDICIKEN